MTIKYQIIFRSLGSEIKHMYNTTNVLKMSTFKIPKLVFLLNG